MPLEKSFIDQDGWILVSCYIPFTCLRTSTVLALKHAEQQYLAIFDRQGWKNNPYILD